MRLLFDESLPRRLATELGGYEVTPLTQLGWAGLGNGDLLRRTVAEVFGILLTGDQNIQYQQNVPKFAIGVEVDPSVKTWFGLALGAPQTDGLGQEHHQLEAPTADAAGAQSLVGTAQHRASGNLLWSEAGSQLQSGPVIHSISGRAIY